MSLLFDAMTSPHAGRANLRFLPHDQRPHTLADLELDSRRAAAWLRHRGGVEGSVAGVLTASYECLAVVFGAWRAGLRVVSLPGPARGMPLEEYGRQLEAMAALTDASTIFFDPGILGLLPPLGVPVASYGDYLAGRGELDGWAGASFVQFTSGSTGTPRGIELSLEAIEANITAMAAWQPPHEGTVECSWLPLSHDMGFIGFTLHPLCMSAAPWSMPVDMVLIAPEAFVADPGLWLRTCAEYQVTQTGGPTFALRLAARSLRARGQRLDLRRLHSIVVGSEPVGAAALRAFEEVVGEHGLRPEAVCPAYGLAEASLAVTIDDTERPWSATEVALGSEVGGLPDAGTAELVACGRALEGVELRIADGATVGELEVRSPSLLTRYVGAPGAAVSAEGWFRTTDVAHLGSDGQLYVIGRTDDVLVIAGRNLDAKDLDRVAAAHPATRPGNCATVADGAGRYLVVAEPNAPVGDADALRRAGREIRVSLAQRFGASPSAVVFIERGTLPKTPSGKLQRNRLADLWHQDRLAVLASS